LTIAAAGDAVAWGQRLTALDDERIAHRRRQRCELTAPIANIAAGSEVGQYRPK
jgi:hypothetical protein